MAWLSLQGRTGEESVQPGRRDGREERRVRLCCATGRGGLASPRCIGCTGEVVDLAVRNEVTQVWQVGGSRSRRSPGRAEQAVTASRRPDALAPRAGPQCDCCETGIAACVAASGPTCTHHHEPRVCGRAAGFLAWAIAAAGPGLGQNRPIRNHDSIPVIPVIPESESTIALILGIRISSRMIPESCQGCQACQVY